MPANGPATPITLSNELQRRRSSSNRAKASKELADANQKQDSDESRLRAGGKPESAMDAERYRTAVKEQYSLAKGVLDQAPPTADESKQRANVEESLKAASGKSKATEMPLSLTKEAEKLNEPAKPALALIVEAAPQEPAAAAAPVQAEAQDFSREAFPPIIENEFKRVTDNRLSTFSIDVDTASYANVRRHLMEHNTFPPKDAVRIEELVNYFRYNDPEPTGDDPFSINIEVARCPWTPDHRLARIGLKGKSIATDQRPASNLVFLIDVSGSMQPANKLPLLKSALRMLVDGLGEKDRVAIVVYAGAEGLALPSTSCYQRGEVLSALDQLQAGGSTNGGAGIKLAYDVATNPQNFIKGGTNRVILCTDGDFNVGVTDEGELNRLIAKKRESKVFLSVLGFGEGNLQETKLKGLAKNGNGNYAYIDTLDEARKVLVEEAGGTLVTIAKDVKIQVEFNPAKVSYYRQIGYELRQLAAEDFNNDAKDAGEIGAGHSVTALYELIPAGKEADVDVAAIDELDFLKPAVDTGKDDARSMVVKLKYKRPTEDKSTPTIRRGVVDDGRDYAQASPDFKFAASVASFGMILRDSKYRGNATLAAVEELAKASIGDNPNSYRRGFLELIRKAREISQR
jgi:Ca-activated chloride channel family protein